MCHCEADRQRERRNERRWTAESILPPVRRLLNKEAEQLITSGTGQEQDLEPEPQSSQHRHLPPDHPSALRQNRVSVYGSSASVAEADQNKERVAAMSCEGKMADVCCD
ncbi:hypothetical protein D4764_20G0000350 [Takifugu flavidus]|uniref:Uncharacterized protein n=1 Tax=Takifugu flavidus TaxID=433684 RepID=A0A5C6NFP8_9TELE|nr:hypothetical protein D4764_20G0000350 [Takifugu flavidus]